MLLEVMLSSAVIGSREVFEVALLTGIILAILNKRGVNGIRTVLIPIAAASAVGLLLGLAAYSVVEIVSEKWYVEVASYLLAAVVVLWVLAWSKSGAESFISNAKTSTSLGLIRGLLFVFVLREAIEVVLMSLPLLAKDASSSLLGLTLGSTIAVFAGAAIYLLGAKIRLSLFFRTMSIMLVLIGFWMVMEASIELGEALEGAFIASELLIAIMIAGYTAAVYKIRT